MLKLLAYNNGSASANALAGSLSIKKLRQERSTWKGKEGDVVINWGRSSPHSSFEGPARVLNDHRAIAIASNKLKSLQALKEAGVPIPEFTTSKAIAREWANIAETVVVCRTILTGHSGAGIVLANNGREVVDAKLYTEYLKKIHEYRIHILGDHSVFVQRKARNREVPDDQVNWQIRNHANGFIFAHLDVNVPDRVIDIARKAVKALGLDFGAVDLIVNKNREAYVLEVNTACGLEGTTLEKYTEYFNTFR